MSYCRFGKDSDVYVYHHYAGHFECCMCTTCDNEEEMLKHLQWHKTKGCKVPDYAIDRLKREINSKAQEREIK